MSRASPFPWARPAPVRLAPGERLVWEGGPSVRSLALRLYHIRLVAAYGVVLTLADAVQARLHGLGQAGALQAVIPGLLTTAGAIGIFALLAWGSARTTRYTLTDHRLVMQFGLALSATLSLPLSCIAAVAVRVRGDGTGDITVLPHAGHKLAYLKLFPFARPWRFATPEPMLRDVPAAGYVASVLSRMTATLKAGASQPGTPLAAPAAALEAA